MIYNDVYMYHADHTKATKDLSQNFSETIDHRPSIMEQRLEHVIRNEMQQEVTIKLQTYTYRIKMN